MNTIKIRDDLKERDICGLGHIVCASFAEGGHPKSGVAYWRYAAIYYQRKLFILEWFPKGQILECIIKEITY